MNKANHASGHERLVYLAAELAGFADLLICLFSLTTFASHYRADVLFSDWAMGED